MVIWNPELFANRTIYARDLLLLALGDTDAQVVHGLLQPWGIKVEVDSFQLAERANTPDVVVVNDLGLLFVPR